LKTSTKALSCRPSEQGARARRRVLTVPKPALPGWLFSRGVALKKFLKKGIQKHLFDL
jgi:hypothetical protein